MLSNLLAGCAQFWNNRQTHKHTHRHRHTHKSKYMSHWNILFFFYIIDSKILSLKKIWIWFFCFGCTAPNFHQWGWLSSWLNHTYWSWNYFPLWPCLLAPSPFPLPFSVKECQIKEEVLLIPIALIHGKRVYSLIYDSLINHFSWFIWIPQNAVFAIRSPDLNTNFVTTFDYVT